jgi:lipopolysaccharide transport system ATP-binding protein
VTAPTSGKIKIKGRIASLLEVGTGFHPELTGRENIYLNGSIFGMSRKEIDRKFDEIVDFTDIEKFIDTPVKRYSSGIYVRLAFAVAAHLDPEILVVDEVLAVGDAEFQKKCLGKMGDVAQHGRTILFVSHNMDAILNLCSSCMILNNGTVAYIGKPDEAVHQYLGFFSKIKTNNLPAHILYDEDEGDQPFQSAKIFRVEALEVSLKPKTSINTWDDIVLRLHYFSDQEYKRGSFIIDVFDYFQQRLVVFDSGLKCSIKKGRHYIDCYIPKLPLSAGDYFLGAGLAISNAQWLWRNVNLSSFQVLGKDVFNLGRPPKSSRMIFAVPHQWQEE